MPNGGTHVFQIIGDYDIDALKTEADRLAAGGGAAADGGAAAGGAAG